MKVNDWKEIFCKNSTHVMKYLPGFVRIRRETCFGCDEVTGEIFRYKMVFSLAVSRPGG